MRAKVDARLSPFAARKRHSIQPRVSRWNRLWSSPKRSLLENFGPNVGPRTPKHHRKPRSTRDQRARRINKIGNPTKSAKPRSPVQIRAAPPNSLGFNGEDYEIDSFGRIFALRRLWPEVLAVGSKNLRPAGCPKVRGTLLGDWSSGNFLPRRRDLGVVQAQLMAGACS